MKDDLKKYINLAYNLDDLILKSLLKVDKSKLYESFMNGHLLFEQTNTDSNELSSLKTSGITDTGTIAPYSDNPYTASSAITYNQRQQSNLPKNPKLRRPWGDPYIYFSATSSNLFAYKCGKDYSNKTITPCPQINANEWKDANRFKNDILKLIFTDTTNTQEQGDQEQGGGQQQNQQLNGDVKKRFRDSFYSTYAYFIAKEYFGNVKVYPTYPTYLTKIEVINGFEDAKTYDFDLVNKTAPEGFVLSDDTLNKSIKNFLTYKKTITIDNVNYNLSTYSSNALYPASSIFKPDTTGYKGDSKLEGLIKTERLGIYKEQ